LSQVLLYRYSAPTDERKAEALEAAQRALELDPASAHAWTAKGAATTIAKDFAAAEAAFERAIELAPAHFEAYYYYGRACAEMGRFEKAAQLYERAAALRPDDYQALLFAAQAYRTLGLEDEARSAERRLLAAGQRAVEVDPTDARAISLTVCGLIGAGRTEEARDWLRRSSALEPDEPYILYNAACAFARLGEPEKSLDVLEQLDFSLLAEGCMAYDPDLDPLREHPRFKALLAHAHDPASAKDQ
jgi:adenylate cyclase